MMNLNLRKETAGYSLVETTVALSLILVVLVPLVDFSVQLATNRLTKEKIEAISIAQEKMERALAKNMCIEGREDSKHGHWDVARDCKHRGGLVVITVSVQKKGSRLPPVVILKTARLSSNRS